jgi:hypothetical protein
MPINLADDVYNFFCYPRLSRFFEREDAQRRSKIEARAGVRDGIGCGSDRLCWHNPGDLCLDWCWFVGNSTFALWWKAITR